MALTYQAEHLTQINLDNVVTGVWQSLPPVERIVPTRRKAQGTNCGGVGHSALPVYLAGNVGLPGAGGSRPNTSCCFWYHSRSERDRSDTLKSLKWERFNADSTSFLS